MGFINLEDDKFSRKKKDVVGKQECTANIVQFFQPSSSEVKKTNNFKAKKRFIPPVAIGISRTKPELWKVGSLHCKSLVKERNQKPIEKANVVPTLTSFITVVGKEKSSSSSDWFIDSGASCHVTSSADLLTDVHEFSRLLPLLTA